MRTPLALATVLLLALAGCGGASNTPEPAAEATLSGTPTEAPTEAPVGSPTTTETTEPSTNTSTSAAPNVGAAALKVGEWREGSVVRSRVSKFVQPSDARLPSYLAGNGSAEGALAEIEMCVRKSSTVVVRNSIWELFSAYDSNGGQYTRASSSWDQWPPLPQLPTEIDVLPGRCARGWLLLTAPPTTKISTVAMTTDDGLIAEWRVG